MHSGVSSPGRREHPEHGHGGEGFFCCVLQTNVHRQHPPSNALYHGYGQSYAAAACGTRPSCQQWLLRHRVPCTMVSCCAVLCCAVLCYAVLCCAAVLCCCVCVCMGGGGGTESLGGTQTKVVTRCCESHVAGLTGRKHKRALRTRNVVLELVVRLPHRQQQADANGLGSDTRTQLSHRTLAGSGGHVTNGVCSR
jgi:hypothetical protein